MISERKEGYRWNGFATDHAFSGGKSRLGILRHVNGIQFLINHFCAILRLDVRKRSLSRCQNLSCEESREGPCISAAAKVGMSAHRADFRKRGGREWLAGHCDQPPIARADSAIPPHLDDL